MQGLFCRSGSALSIIASISRRQTCDTAANRKWKESSLTKEKRLQIAKTKWSGLIPAWLRQSQAFCFERKEKRCDCQTPGFAWTPFGINGRTDHSVPNCGRSELHSEPSLPTPELWKAPAAAADRRPGSFPKGSEFKGIFSLYTYTYIHMKERNIFT